MTDPTDGRGSVPTALVLVASPNLAESLRRVRKSGWAGPVVVVGDTGEATELARSPRPGPTGPGPQPGATGPGPQPGATGPGPRPGPSGAERQPGPASPAPPSRLELMLDPDRQLVASGGRQVT